MGLLLGALAGAGDYIANAAKEHTRFLDQQDLDNQRADIALQKERAIEQLRMDNLETVRQKRIGDIESQLQKNANADVEASVDPLPSTQTDGTPMPQEAQSNYAQAKGLIQQAYKDDLHNQLQAEVDAGYGNRTDLIKLQGEDRKNKALEQNNLLAQQRLDIQQQLADARQQDADTNQQRMLMIMERFSSGQSSSSENKELLSYLSEVRKKLATDEESVIQTMNAAMAQTTSLSKKKEIAALYAQQLKAISTQSAALDQDYAQVRKKLGFTSDARSTEKENKSIPGVGKSVLDKLPQGAVQIGTSNGKPVYQTPDGKKFIAN